MDEPPNGEQPEQSDADEPKPSEAQEKEPTPSDGHWLRASSKPRDAGEDR
jgi:hypothetical protein